MKNPENIKKTLSALPLVVLFGRPNVGKSTLFNRLTEKSHALVSAQPGTTRDANEGIAEWQGKNFTLIDTGGIMDPGLLKLTKKQKQKISQAGQRDATAIDILAQKKAEEYLEKADLVLFMLDAREGLMPQDKEIAEIIRRKINPEKIILVANKNDHARLRSQSAEFNRLGLGEPALISATIGSGTGDLLEEVIKRLPKKKINKKIEAGAPISVSIIGKPNVGKSSLVNAILGENKIIVSPLPHTTREPNDTLIEYSGHAIKLIDTAGISKTGQKSARRKASKETLEKLSIEKSLKTLKNSEIGLLVIDVHEGLGHQETKLVEAITKTNTSLVIVANKWDLMAEKDVKQATRRIYSVLPFATWAPIIFVSALTGAKVKKILDLAIEIHQARQVELSEKELDRFLREAVKNHSPKASTGVKRPYIHKLKQENSNPPQFSLTIGRHDSLAENYVRYMGNRLREKLKIIGTPISIYVKKKSSTHGQHSDPFDKPVR